MSKKILIIGGIPNPIRKVGYGGATVLMQNFIDYLNDKHISFSFLQTNRYYDKNERPLVILNSIVFTMLFLAHIPFCKGIMFNFSDHATVKIYPYLLRIAKLFHRKVIFRKFGGTLDLYLDGIDEKKQKSVFYAIESANLVLFETKATIQYILNHIDGSKTDIVWFPNVRKSTEIRTEKHYSKKFVFISHILDEKGVGDLLQVAQLLPNDYTIDFYGPIKEPKYLNFDWESNHVHYGGVLTSAEVLQTLEKYNVLLLTSYREGYPGIIIEAMSVGMPVITTPVGGITEIIVNGYNGFLVPPGNIDKIKKCIETVSQEIYDQMRLNSLKTFNDYFDSERTNARILEKILSLL